MFQHEAMITHNQIYAFQCLAAPGRQIGRFACFGESVDIVAKDEVDAEGANFTLDRLAELGRVRIVEELFVRVDDSDLLVL